MSDASPSTDHSPTSTEEETLPLLYDLDKLTQIQEGEFTKDIPPLPIGEFNKKKKQNSTRTGQPGTSSAPAGSGNQVEVEEEEDGEEEEEESDDENDERPPRSTNQRTLEERLRRELEYIDNLLEQDEDADQENLSVPREHWRAADFVEEDLVYASIDVLVLDARRHLQTVERNSTLRLYTSWIYHFKRWAAKMLRQIRSKLPQEHRLKHVDEIGHYIRDNKKKNWDQEADVPRAYVWLHGPRVTKTRLRAYVKYMVRELKLDAESSKEGDNATGTQSVQSTTVHTLLGRIKACQMAARVEATLYRETELSIMREILVVRSEIGQFHGVRLIPPVDTSTRASWYKKHLFFAKNDTDQGELSVASHQHWARQLWDKNGVFCKRNVHAARARGAQELAIDGTPRAEIAELGHWALDKMTRAYITTIPVGVVMKKTGYSGYKQDYFLGRSRVEPSEKLLKLLAEHIFPGVDDMLKTAEGKAANGSDADKAAVHFWRTLQMLRRIVAEDLAVKLVRTPWHPYVQGSMLCRIPLFQHWAKWVERVDTETINKRRDPTQIQAEEISVRFDTEYYNMSLKEKLTKEMERTANEKIDFLEELEKRDGTIVSLTAEIIRLTEALRMSEARRVPEAPPSATAQAPSKGGSADSANTGAGADRGDEKPPPPPQTDEEASYELNVVQPWREAKTGRDAWRLWNSATANDTRRLCDRFGEPCFVDRHTLLSRATQGALNMRVRRMLRVMDAVRQLRARDGDADTEEVVDALHRIAAPGIGTFADALTVLKPGTAPMLSKEPSMGVKGLGPKVVSKLRLACALVALNLKPTVWVETLFPDTWVEQMPKTKADLAKPTAPAKSTAPAKPTAPVHRPPTKRKKSA
ncbi:unnamed protein product [Closterium sp. Naga37s-1]|nr:unnamed protein product [Closterium sp. Naga37s-1]